MCCRCSLRGTLEDSAWNKTSAFKKKERKEEKKQKQKAYKWT